MRSELKPSLVHVCCFFALTVARVLGNEHLCGDLNTNTLQLVIVLFRHGDRTPIGTYKNDPYQQATWLPWGGWGFLTQKGMLQHYNFGQWMRHCYGSFLNETYRPANVFVRASDFARTLDSASCYLAGLYPPNGLQNWSTITTLSSYWQPIPIHNEPAEEDYLLNNEIPCPPFDSLYHEIWDNAAEIQRIQAENQALLDYISENAGIPLPGDLYKVSQICDSVAVEKSNGLKQPEWLNETVQSKLELWDNLAINVETANDEMIRYFGGELVAFVQEIMINKTTGLMSQQLIVLSAHDKTVAALLATYGEFNKVRPPYASAAFTELHLDPTNGRYFVKTFYRNDTANDPMPLRIRNCGNPCWVDQYIREIQPLSLESKEQACFGSPDNYGLADIAIIAIAVIVSIGFVLIVTMVVLAKSKACKRKYLTDAFSYERLED